MAIERDLSSYSLSDELKKFEEKGLLIPDILKQNHQPMSKELKYGYSFAELLDRATIVAMKIANSKDPKAFEEELKDILHDIQIHLNEKPMTAEQVKGLIVLTQVNAFIWRNEEAVRDSDDGKVSDEDLLPMLKKSHQANSLRGEAKKHIQLQRKSRVDEKLNYGKSSGFMNMKF